jgi:hypothetical protein
MKAVNCHSEGAETWPITKLFIEVGVSLMPKATF